MAESSVSLDTANGAQGPKLQTALQKSLGKMMQDAGENCEYGLENVVHNPNSPFNILSVGQASVIFGHADFPPSSDDE